MTDKEDPERVVWETWQIRPGEEVTAELIRERGRRWVEQSPEAAAFRALMGDDPEKRQERNRRKAARRKERRK